MTKWHTYWMQHACKLATQAAKMDEIPVGAVIVKNNKCMGEGFNQPRSLSDPTAHAEIIALRNAGQSLKNYRLKDCILYVTLEPCAMCVGALYHARIKTVVYGASDPKAGALGGALDLRSSSHWNHHFSIEKNIEAAVCSDLLQVFFKKLRSNEKHLNF